MPAIYHHPHTVTDEESDAQGHANNLCYLQWMIDAAVAHSTAQGWPPERYLQAGLSWVVRSHEIHYHQPCFPGERIEVVTWVASFRRIRSLRKYRITRPADQALLAEAETMWAFVALPDLTPRRVPAELIQSFEVVEQ